MSASKKHKVLLVSTDSNSGRGGIANTVRSFVLAFQQLGFEVRPVVSHNLNSYTGKWLPFCLTLFTILQEVISARVHQYNLTVWMHVGGPVSVVRKFIIGSFARLLGVEVIIHLHSASTELFLDGSWKKSFFNFMLTPAHKVVVVSDWWRSRLVDFAKNKPFYLCSNCIEAFTDSVEIIGPKKSTQLDNSAIKILAMSRMVEGKGFDLLLEGIALCSGKYEVLMAGDGDLRPELEKQVTRLGLGDRVTFVGWLDEKRKAEILHSVDIFCLPSQNDSFGMVYIEAMKAGLPIIAFDYAPVRSVIGERAALYVKTPHEFSSALDELSSSTQKRSTMAAAGVKRVADCYSIQNVKCQIENILNDFMGS